MLPVSYVVQSSINSFVGPCYCQALYAKQACSMLSVGETYVLSDTMGPTQAGAPLPLQQEEILGRPIPSTEPAHALALS